jgi:Putative beta barrel porin-7 (BBP7)
MEVVEDMITGRILATTVALLAGVGLAYAQQPGVASTPSIPPPPALLAGPPTVALTGNLGPANSQLWVDGEYLYWLMKGSQLPPLLIPGNTTVATLGPTSVPVPAIPGFTLVTSPTSVNTTAPLSMSQALVGGGIDQNWRDGGRFTVGYWLDADQAFGVEASYFFLRSRSTYMTSGSNGSPPLVIPFVNAGTGQESSYTIAQPTATVTTSTNLTIGGVPIAHISDTTTTTGTSGSVAIGSSSQLQGSEANVLWSALRGPRSSLELLAGVRWAQLDDDLGLDSTVIQTKAQTTVTSGAIIPASTLLNNFTSQVNRSDRFEAHNNFYGGQVGARGEYSYGWLSLSAEGKVALGTMTETVNSAGSTMMSTTSTITPTVFPIPGFPVPSAGGPPVTTKANQLGFGGLFAPPSNSGRTRNVFAVVPDVNVKVGFDLTQRLRATVGYSFLYMSDVVRAGEQIDRTINPALLASPPVAGVPFRPAFQFQSTDFWAHGLDVGLEFRY